MCWYLDYNVDGVEFQIVVTRKAMCLQTIVKRPLTQMTQGGAFRVVWVFRKVFIKFTEILIN